jgi:hypothetical protein
MTSMASSKVLKNSVYGPREKISEVLFNDLNDLNLLNGLNSEQSLAR